MTRLVLCLWLLYVLQITDAASFKTSRDSCIPARSRVSRRQVQMVCYPYIKRQKGYCRDVIGDWLVKKSPEEQQSLENDLKRIDVTKRLILQLYNIKISRGCLSAFNDVYCRWSFPKCDTNTAKLTVQTICRESCEYVYKMCAAELKLATPLMTPSQIMNCSEMASRNGGESPGCYRTIYSNTETDKLPASECFYGNGFGYHGNVSVTRNGHVCQSWSSQCPHRHDHPLSVYPELVNASNWCRNPGGQGLNGPWCYTTNSSVRWEYCDVEKCPPPAPSRAPTISQVSARGSNKVYLAWRPIPLPFMHGQLRGFRIFVKNLDAPQRHERHIANITDPSVTSIELGDLEPLTNYSFSVLAFNENGDSPCSRAVFVQTMPENFISVQFILALKGQKFHHHLLEKQSRRYQKLALQIKRKVSRILKKPKTKGYGIFHIEISRFSKGSVLVEFYVTAQVLGFLPHWSIVQDITGRMMNQSAGPRTKSGKMDFSSLVVQYSPPPPANVSHSEATVNSAKVYWSPPLYHEPYMIKNYTVQYKKANTKMSYYDAISSNNTNVIVDNLDVETKYLMRVVSVNAYGSSASQPMTVKTKSKSTYSNTALTIVLSVTAAVIVVTIIVIVVAWRRWSRKRKYLAKTNPQDLFEALGIETTKDWWEMPRDILLLKDQLGSGSFGVVMRAYLTKEDNTNKTLCAVKMLKDNPTERELRDLCNEINLMTLVGDHPNIISLIGACTLNGPPWLVVKYAVNGSLLQYLEDNRETPVYSNLENLDNGIMKIPPERKLRFAYDIAKGMSHLEKKRVVHRDLSARNILLGRNMVAMVSDFGLSRDVYQMGVYESSRAGVLPVRWMSLESLETYTYTTESDVWSYGVVLWEIENGGRHPYAGMDNGLQILEYLKQGHRLQNLENASRDIETIMQECWNFKPKQRPTFPSLVNRLGQLLERHGHERRDPEDGYYDLGNNTSYHGNNEMDLAEFAHGGDMEGAPHDNPGCENNDNNTPKESSATPIPTKRNVTMTTNNDISQC